MYTSFEAYESATGDPMQIETVELTVCVDCYLYAGGALEGDSTAQETAHARVARDNSILPMHVTLVGADEEDEDGHFSWSPCEFCLSTLGGDRHAATLLLSTYQG